MLARRSMNGLSPGKRNAPIMMSFRSFSTACIDRNTAGSALSWARMAYSSPNSAPTASCKVCSLMSMLLCVKIDTSYRFAAVSPPL